MKLTIELPDPKGPDVEQQLVDEFSQLVTTLRAILSTYKSEDREVPSISLRVPNKFKVVREAPESKQFVDELLKFHLDRVPTADVPAQRRVLKTLYESGYTDKQDLLDRYATSLKEYALTSWLTVRWKLVNQPKFEEAKKTELEFQRAELSEQDREELAKRLKNNLTE